MSERRDDGDYRPCAGMMVLNRQGLVWVGRRIGGLNEPEGPGLWWQMPQGGIDGDEDPAKAAVRELYEETSIRSVLIVGEARDWLYYDLPRDLRPKAWGGRYKGQRQKWFAMSFSGPESEIDLKPPGHKAEFDAWKWVAIDELPSLIVPFKRDIYAAVAREFSALAKPIQA